MVINEKAETKDASAASSWALPPQHNLAAKKIKLGLRRFCREVFLFLFCYVCLSSTACSVVLAASQFCHDVRESHARYRAVSIFNSTATDTDLDSEN